MRSKARGTPRPSARAAWRRLPRRSPGESRGPIPSVPGTTASGFRSRPHSTKFSSLCERSISMLPRPISPGSSRTRRRGRRSSLRRQASRLPGYARSASRSGSGCSAGCAASSSYRIIRSTLRGRDPGVVRKRLLMRILLDTHIPIWAITTPERLETEARAAILDAANDVLFSAASIWEIAIKTTLSRRDFGCSHTPSRKRRAILVLSNCQSLRVSPQRCAKFAADPPRPV